MTHFCSFAVNPLLIDKIISKFDSFIINGWPCNVPYFTKKIIQLNKKFTFIPTLDSAGNLANLNINEYECIIQVGGMGEPNINLPYIDLYGHNSTISQSRNLPDDLDLSGITFTFYSGKDSGLNIKIDKSLSDISVTLPSVSVDQTIVSSKSDKQRIMTDLWINYCINSFNSGKFKESITILTNALEMNHSNPILWYLKMSAHINLGFHGDALRASRNFLLYATSSINHSFIENSKHSMNRYLKSRFNSLVADNKQYDALDILKLYCFLFPEDNEVRKNMDKLEYKLS